MLVEKLLDLIFVRLPLRVLKRNVIPQISSCGKLPSRALVYFKTDPLFSRRLRDAYVHTNNAEIMAMIDVLNRFGFSVDLVDRDADWSQIKPLMSSNYDLYLGNAAGNSAPHHDRINSEIRAKHRIFFAAGPEPTVSNLLVAKRHEYFNSRTRADCVVRRLVKGEGLDLRFRNMDAIFYVGNEFSRETYSSHGLPMHRIFPSTSPKITFDLSAIEEKRSNRFLYFGGNGLICKGLDLVLEAFDRLEGVELDICAPSSEADFWTYYAPLLRRNSHIRFHGFVQTGGSAFNRMTAAAAFQIFPGSAEGCATSVVTCMRRGVIPVTTRESGVDIGDFGVNITDSTVGGLRRMIGGLRSMGLPELRERAFDTYCASMNYTLETFRNSFEAALLKTLILRNT